MPTWPLAGAHSCTEAPKPMAFFLLLRLPLPLWRLQLLLLGLLLLKVELLLVGVP